MDIIKFNDLIDKGSFDAGSDAIAKSLGKITEEIKRAKQVAEEFAVIMGNRLKGEITQISSASKKLAKDMADMDSKMTQFKTTASNTTKVISDYEKENERLRKELEKLNKELEENARAQKKSTAATTAGVNSTKQLATSFIGLAGGTALIHRGIQGLTQMLKDAVKSTIAFEKVMKEVQAVSRATDTELKSLEKNANKLGATTEKLAVDVANVQKEMAKLGLTASEVIVSTKAIVDLSTATGEDLVNSAIVATSTMRAFGLEASDMTHIVDVMTGSFVRSGLDLDKFRESMKLVAPIARAVNVDIETTTAMLSKLADAGLSGSLAGTALRNLMSSMADPTEKLAVRLGGAITSSDGLIKSFIKLKREGIDLSEAVQLVDVRARPAFFTLVNQAEAVEALSVEYKHLKDETSTVAREMRDTLANDVDVATSAFDSLRRNLIDDYTPAMRQATQTTTKFVEALRLFNDGVILQDNILVILIEKYVNWLKMVNPLSVSYNVLTTAIDGISSAMSEMGIEVSSLSEIVEDGLSTETFDAIDTTMGQVANSTLKLTEQYGAFTQANTILSQGLEDTSAGTQQLRDEFPELSGRIEDNREFLIILRSDIGKNIEATRSYITTLKDHEVELETMIDSYKEQAKVSKLTADQQEILRVSELKLIDVKKIRDKLETRMLGIITDLTKLSQTYNESIEEQITLKTKLSKLQSTLNTEHYKTAELIAKNAFDEEESLRMKIPLLNKLQEAREKSAKAGLSAEVEAINTAEAKDSEKTLMRSIAYEKYTQTKINLERQYQKEYETITDQIINIEDDMFMEVVNYYDQKIKKKEEARTAESKLRGDINKDLEKWASTAFDRDKRQAELAQKALKDADKKELDALKEKEQMRQTIIQESTRAIANITRSLFDNRQIKREDELNEIRVWEEEKLRLAGDNEDAKLIIKEEVARRESEIKIKQAKDNKAEAMFQILIDTASAVVASLPNIPLSIFVGALGLAQLTAVASRPIPQFEKGTAFSPEGTAEVAERGRELIVDGKTGQARIAEKRQYTHLTKGSVVVPNAQTEQLLRAGNVDHNTLAYEALNRMSAMASNNTIDYSKMGDAFMKGAQSIPQSQTNFDENGVRNFVIKGGSRVERLNKRYKYT